MALLIFLFWIVLNGRVTAEIALLGAAVTALAMFFLCGACDWSLKKERKFYWVLPRVTYFIAAVLREIVKANLRMLPVVWGQRPDPVVRTIETRLKTRLGKMALSNAITLTPGTITLAVEGSRLTVHCLTPAMADGLDHTVFEEKLQKVEEALRG